jgi:hypothetical protein
MHSIVIPTPHTPLPLTPYPLPLTPPPPFLLQHWWAAVTRLTPPMLNYIYYLLAMAVAVDF